MLKPFRFETRFEGGRLVYGRLPPFDSRERELRTADWSIDLSFAGHGRAVLRAPNGRLWERAIEPGTGAIYASGMTEFIKLERPSEFVEIVVSEDLRRAVADECRAPAAFAMGDHHNMSDAVLWACSARFRALAVGGLQPSEVELDTLVHLTLRSLFLNRFGGRPVRINSHGLDQRRLARVTEFIEDNLMGSLSIGALADHAAVSRFQFIRAFKATIGLTPHAYITARRMACADRLLNERSHDISSVARAVGYVSGHSFRKAFRAYFGTLPSRRDRLR